MTLDDIDLVEINEAFASVVLAWQKETGADLQGQRQRRRHRPRPPARRHGARLMTTLVNELERTGGRYGLQTMCEGGGQANVTIIEGFEPLKVGLFFDLRNPPGWRRPWADHYAATLELIEGAEAKGADAVWLSEHHFFEDGYLPQPLTFAAAVAARTARVRIGTAITIAALRHPLHLAEEAAIVDILSAGRVELGIGASYRIPYYETVGAA